MKNKLLELELLLKNNNPNLITFFNKDRVNDIISFFKDLNLIINYDDELFSLYNWYNGTSINNNENCLTFCLFPDFVFLTIHDLKKYYFEDYYYSFKSKNMIPIFRSCSGDYIAIKVEEYNQNASNAKLYLCSPRVVNSENNISIYDNLNTFIESVILCYKKNIYFLNEEDELLDEDLDESIKFNTKINPTSDLWKNLNIYN